MSRHIRFGWLSLLSLMLAAIPLLPSRAALDVDSLYHRTMEVYHSETWELADSLSALALAEIESQEMRDWVYRGARKPIGVAFSGQYILVGLSDKDKEESLNRMEVYDPQKDELVRIYDFTPWLIRGAIFAKTWLLVTLHKEGYLGYEILRMKEGETEIREPILREGIEEFKFPWRVDTDYIEVFEKGPKGVTLSVFDLPSGQMKELHTFETFDKNQSIWNYSFKFVKDSTRWLFLDGNHLYSVDTRTWQKKPVRTLPFEATPDVNFWKKEMIEVVRGDTLFMLPLRQDGRGYDLKITHLPYSMDNYLRVESDVDEGCRWLSHTDMDSLRIFKIVGDTVQQVLSTKSSFGGAVLIYSDTFWKGDTLIHYGNAGLQIYKGAEPLASVETGEVHILLCDDVSVLFMYEPPNAFTVFDLNTLDTLWTKRYEVVHSDVFNFLDCQHVYINHNEGTSVLDVRTGQELFRSSQVAQGAILMGDDTTKVAILGDNFLGVFDFPSRRKLKSDLIAVAALSRWAAGDSVEAVRDARRALALGTDLHRGLPEDLFKIFDFMKLDIEALRLAGNMALRTDQSLWRKKLMDAGMEFLTPPYFGLVTVPLCLQGGVFAFQANFNPATIIRGDPLKCYWFARSGYDPEGQSFHIIKLMRVSGLNSLDQDVVLYEYSLDTLGRKIQWEPLLMTWSGKVENLGPLLETPLPEADPNDLTYPWFEEEPLFHPNLKDRAVLDLTQRNPVRRSTHITVGIDLTGEGKNWADSTIQLPVRVGERYFAHKYYGDFLTLVYEGSQADSIGMREGDVVISFGGHSFSNIIGIGEVKNFYPLRMPLELSALRGADTLHYTVFNGLIGYEHQPSFTLVELDPETGDHLSNINFPPGYYPRGVNSSGDIVYTLADTLLFFNPITLDQKKLPMAEIKDFQRYSHTYPYKDILLMHNSQGEEIIALDMSKTADDSNRMLWKQKFDNIYWHDGYPRFCYSDDEEVIPLLLNDGSLMILDVTTGVMLAREDIPFKSFGYVPQLVGGTLCGAAAGRIFGWRVAYYNPPFPWTSVGYGALAFVPLLIASVSVNRMRIHRLKRKQAEELEREGFRQEIRMAADIHRKIVPTPESLPSIDGFAVYGYNYPCKEVGGDYFDIISMPDGRYGFVVCDVSGKGLPAALLVSSLQATFQTLFQSNTKLLNIAQRTNIILHRNTTPDRFATGFIGIIDPRRYSIETVNAGHDTPLLLRASGEVERLTAGGLGFGMFDFSTYSSYKTRLYPGDIIYLYTDGITEALNPGGEEFGVHRLETFVTSNAWASPQEMLEKIEQQIRTWTQQFSAGNGFPHDDFTQLAIQMVKGG